MSGPQALTRAALLRGDHTEAVALLNDIDDPRDTSSAAHVSAQLATPRLEAMTCGQIMSSRSSSLSTTERRVLQLLPTHLTIPEIATRLGASSRSEAVDVAAAAGLVALQHPSQGLSFGLESTRLRALRESHGAPAP
jgi:hypothetical protein